MMKPMMEEEEYSGGSPMDEIIAQVDAYIENPKMITPETMMELREKLVDVKSIIDGDDREGMDESPGDGYNDSTDQAEPKGLTIMIGNMRKKNKGEQE